MNDSTRVFWNEVREGELYFVIGDAVGNDWTFFSRSSWEIRWYELPATEQRIKTANALRAALRPRDAA
jgi:hypothetical protein